MKTNKRNILLLPILYLLLVMQFSCKVVKPYEKPELGKINDHFRGDSGIDTASITELRWKDFFKDTILQRYIQEAIQNNYDIKIAVEQFKIATNYLSQSRAMYFPNLNAGPAISYQSPSQHTQLGQIIGDRRHNVLYDIGADFNWEADIWGKLKSNERAARAEALQSEFTQQVVLSRIVAEVADTYFELMALDEQLIILDTTITNRNNNVIVTKALKESGILTEVAVQQSEAQEMNVRAQAIFTQAQIRMLENYLCLLMGRSPSNIQRGNLNTQLLPDNLKAGVPAQLLRNRPDVIAAEFDFVTAFELTNVARTNFYPALNITGSFGLQSLDASALFTPEAIFFNILAGLTQPILNQRRLKTQLANSKNQENIALLNYKKTFLTATHEVSDALFAMQSQNEIASIKKIELEAYLNAIEYSKELVNYGMANYLEVLRATDNALNTELAMINAKYGYLSASVKLYRALGGGWK